jgi:hypothetical protein
LCGLNPFSLRGFPGEAAAKILPKALQPPDHVHLPARKMFEQAVADQPRDVLPVVKPLIGNLFLQDRANGNHGGKRIPEDEELQKKLAAQNTKRGSENDGDDSRELEHWGKQLKDPQVGQTETANPGVTRPEKHVAIGPQHVQQALLPALPLLSQRFQIGGGPTPPGPLLLSLRESTRWPIPSSRPDRSARTSEFPSILFPLRANARTSSEPEHATHAHACLAEPQRLGGQQSLLQKPNPALRYISSLLPATQAAAFANPLVQPIAIRQRSTQRIGATASREVPE